MEVDFEKEILSLCSKLSLPEMKRVLAEVQSICKLSSDLVSFHLSQRQLSAEDFEVITRV